jgi:hypothetical protein
MILYPERDVIIYGEYTTYPEGYELDVVYNICHIYFKNCDKLVASIVDFCDSIVRQNSYYSGK